MAYYIVVAGGSLYSVNTSGSALALTLPSGVTIDSTRRARMTVLGRNVIVANAPSRSLLITPRNVVYPLMLQPPVSAPVVAAGASGGLTGTYNAKFTHIIKDPLTGALLAESDFSPIAANVTIAAKLLAASGVSISNDSAITHRRLYRPTTGPGSVYYPWVDLEGNVNTTVSDDLSDALLDNIAAPTELGFMNGMLTGTRQTLIAEWKNRLFAVGDFDIDTLRFSGVGLGYAWPSSYGLTIPPVGDDSFGITGLLPRRDELGVGRRRHLYKIVGTPPSALDVVRVKVGKGVVGSDTCLVVDDIGYFLSDDGFYSWKSDGIECVSDGRVRRWFTSDDYFNRSQFPNAFTKYNQRYGRIELHLAAAGSSAIDRWVEYDIASGKWYGPHLTSAFTPTYGFVIIDGNNQTVPVIGGSNGFLYQENQSTLLDDATTIAWDWRSKYHDANTPQVLKVWKRPMLATKIQSLFGNTSLAIRVGKLNAAIRQTFTPDARLGVEEFTDVGEGEFMQIGLSGSTVSGQGYELYGYEVPYHEVRQQSR